MPLSKIYLGDGVYVEFDNAAFWLTTSNGLVETNRICLEPEVMANLLKWLKSLGVTMEEV